MSSSGGIEGDVRRSLLDRPDAEKVFQPWWDSVEDYLLNTLIALGGDLNIKMVLLDFFHHHMFKSSL